jgi:hypothetical protein
VFRKLGHCQPGLRKTRIIAVDLKNDARDRIPRFALRRELSSSTDDDPAVDSLAARPITPPKLPYYLSILAFGFHEASVLHACSFLHRKRPVETVSTIT